MEDFNIRDCILCGHRTDNHNYETTIQNEVGMIFITCHVTCKETINYDTNPHTICNCSGGISRSIYKLANITKEEGTEGNNK